MVENRFDHATLDRVVITWRWEHLGPTGFETLAEQAATPPAIEPGGRWRLPLGPPPTNTDALRVVVHGPAPFRGLDDPPLVDQRTPLATAREAARLLRVVDPAAPSVESSVDVDAGTLALRVGDRRLDLPLPVATGEPSPTLVARRSIDAPGRHGVELRFAGRLQRLRVETFPSGWTRVVWTLDEDRDDGLPGVVLPIDETAVDRVEWLGLGPSRVWGNRRHGQWGLHAANRADAVAERWGHEPRFRGYYAARRAVVHGPAGPWTLQVEDSAIHVGVFAPRFPDDAKEATASVHAPDGLAFVHHLPSIGTKFHAADALAPKDAEADPRGLHAGAVWIALGDHLPSAAEPRRTASSESMAIPRSGSGSPSRTWSTTSRPR